MLKYTSKILFFFVCFIYFSGLLVVQIKFRLKPWLYSTKLEGACHPSPLNYKNYEQLGVITLLDAIYTNGITPFMEL